MRNEDWTIQFNIENPLPEPPRKWVDEVNRDLINRPQTRSAESRRWAKQSIYKIPSNLEELSSKAYKPQIVAIGPYHHGEDSLEGVDEHKHRALLTFLERSRKPLECYVNALAAALEDLKDAYHHLPRCWKENNAAFLQLMMVDGCFVLEIMRAATAGSPETAKEMGYARNDPLFSYHGIISFVHFLKRDMLMLENQLPLRALAILLAAEYDVVTADGLSELQDQLTKLILNFFFPILHGERDNEEYRDSFHILDIYRKTLLMGFPSQKRTPKKSYYDCLNSPGLNKEEIYVRSATELTRAGIRFEQSKSRKLDDVSFHRGVLKLPLIIADDVLESVYLNLMAFEQFHVGVGKDVTAFVFFMASIIYNARDVSLLHSRGIIINLLGSDEALANMFNSLSRDVTLDPECGIGDVARKVSDHCQMGVPRFMSYVKHYLKNPWFLLSVVAGVPSAAVILFVLACIQTVYSILDYHGGIK